MDAYYTYKTQLGDITIESCVDAIVALRFGRFSPDGSDGSPSTAVLGRNTQAVTLGSNRQTELTDKAALQLEEYLKGERRLFDLPLRPRGTVFQQAVWDAPLDIPYGETRSYRQIAGAIGKPNACRAVGMANNRNPIAIVIPCHRVIGADGSLVGYGGGLHVKKKLLDLEMGFDIRASS